MAEAESSARTRTPPSTTEAAVRASPTASVYAHRFALYSSYFFAAFGDRMWEFGSVIFIMALFPSTLLWSSLFGLLELAAGVVAGPYIGRAIDSATTSRLSLVRTSIYGQNTAIAAAAVVLLLLLRALPDPSSLFLYGGLVVLTAASMGAKAASSLNKVVVHKCFVVVLSEGHSERLASLNGAMRGIDLSCSVLAPLMVGLGEAAVGQQATVILVGLWAALSLFVELTLVNRVGRVAPSLATPERGTSGHATDIVVVAGTASKEDLTTRLLADGGGTMDLASSPSASPASPPVPPPPPRSWWASFSSYSAHAVFLPSFAYCLLYVSILSFGGIMTSYLSSSAVALSPALLAVGRAIAALVGLLSTLTVPWFIRRLGLLRSGHLALLAQSFCLGFAVLAMYVGVQGSTGLLLLFVGLCSSRYGLWSYDLVETQIMQEGVEANEVGAINGVQESLTNVMMGASFALTIVWSRPADILYPVWLSFVSVLLATALYTHWAVGGGGQQWEEQRLSSRRVPPTGGGK